MPSIPSVWNYYELLDGSKPQGRGYATYRIQVKGAKPGKELAMRIQPLSTAYELYIDDKLMTSCGKTGTTESDTLPQYAIRVFSFIPEKSDFDIIIHISNFVYARGGLWYSFDLGTPELIDHLDRLIFLHDAIAVGLFLFMLIHSIFYALLRKDKYLILFMAADILVILKIIISGGYIINFLFSHVTYNTYVQLMYIPICILPSICLLIVYHYYPVRISKNLIRVSAIFSVCGSLSAAFMPIFLFTQLTYIILGIITIPVIYGICKLMWEFIDDPQKPLDILFMAVGLMAVLLCAVRDIMFNENLISYGRMDSLPFGALILMLSWEMSNTYRYELMIRDRVRVLRELNSASERERELELRFLKSQIRPHFINNALNTIISISRTDPDEARRLLLQFSKYLRSRYDFENLDDLVPVEQELEYVKAYLAIECARFGDKLKIQYDLEDVTLLVPLLILQPLVENAVQHAVRGNSESSLIRIYINSAGDFVNLGVTDSGPGMSQEQIERALSGAPQKSGIALYNINERLKKLYNTGLKFKSLPEGGLDVAAIIPKSSIIGPGSVN